jgi:hypothetical protein
VGVIAGSGSVAVDVAGDVTGSSGAGAGDDETGGSDEVAMARTPQPGKTSREQINRALICNLIVLIETIIASDEMFGII